MATSGNPERSLENQLELLRSVSVTDSAQRVLHGIKQRARWQRRQVTAASFGACVSAIGAMHFASLGDAFESIGLTLSTAVLIFAAWRSAGYAATLAALKSGALPRFRGDAKLSTWIYRITLRVGTRWLAKRGAAAELPPTLFAADHSIPIDLINALRKLPIDYRMVILLVAIEGLSHSEVAEVLAIPAGTVASRMHYARKRLTDLLAC